MWSKLDNRDKNETRQNLSHSFPFLCTSSYVFDFLPYFNYYFEVSMDTNSTVKVNITLKR